jgi:hypothetical protein
MRNYVENLKDQRFNSEGLHTTNNEEILPFPEEPRVEDIDGPRKRVDADELFSLFTANIIKKNTFFTR